jgi:hypothetical protein
MKKETQTQEYKVDRATNYFVLHLHQFLINYDNEERLDGKEPDAKPLIKLSKKQKIKALLAVTNSLAQKNL